MLEDIDRKLPVRRNDAGLRRIADGCNGVPCIMLMSKRSGSWAPHRANWGLIDARTGRDVDPVALISDARIEMTASGSARLRGAGGAPEPRERRPEDHVDARRSIAVPSVWSWARAAPNG